MSSSKHPRVHRAQSSSSTTHAVLVAVQLPGMSDSDIQRSLDELSHLVTGLGMPIVGRVLQKRSQPAASTYVGEGKLRELAALTGGTGEVIRGPASAQHEHESRRDDLLVVTNDELTAAQVRNLESALAVTVLDRTTVILRVFEERAQTREARLEVEAAQLTYQLPRIRDDHSLGDKEGGGGRAGKGHSNVELAKQRHRDRIAGIRRELDALKATEERTRESRSETFSAALVGYTNAGKSSLMRLLTGSDVLAENKLFATLGTTVRPLQPASVPPVLVVDTVGFIDRLPHGLIASFRATLAEARDAWLVLNVVDASDPNFRTHLRVTGSVLDTIGAGSKPTLLVFNKIDLLSTSERNALAGEFPDAIPMNALDPEDGRMLRQRIAAHFDCHLEEATFTIPYARQAVLASMRDQVRVVGEEYGAEIVVRVAGTRAVLGRMRKLLA